jgi:predicted GNAT family N-acyltransferase
MPVRRRNPQRRLISGVLYRGGGSPSYERGLTVKDVLAYERDELGNALTVYPHDPDASARTLQWLATTKHDAEEYGPASPVEVPAGSLVVAEDPFGGLLVSLAGRTHNPPLFPGAAGWDPAWTVVVDDDSPRLRRIFVVRGGHVSADNIVAHMLLSKSKQARGAWRVNRVWIEREHQRKGLAQMLYLLAMKMLGRIHPDWEVAVSPAALRVWQALIQHGLVKSWPTTYFHGAHIKGLDQTDDGIITAEGLRVVFPKGWRGILDRVYELEDPSSVPLHALKGAHA